MNITHRSDCIEAAAHWEKLAGEAEDKAARERSLRLDLSAPGHSPGDNQAATYRRVARSLLLEAETGKPHCQCHLSQHCSSQQRRP